MSIRASFLCRCLAGATAAISALAAPGYAETVADSPPVFETLPRTTLNFYGSPGLMDMPDASMLNDGVFATTLSYFGGTGRYTLTFQAFPWMSASFRYNSINDLNLFGFSTYYDRSFDVRFRLRRESRYFPELTLGLQDFAGTGLYSGEYIVATKRFEAPWLSWSDHRNGKLKLTAGLGWGRLGSSGALGSPFGARPAGFTGGTGGQIAYDTWFRGPMAPFAGIEWQPNDRWGFKVEYSSDAYDLETQTSNVFERKSRFNFGVEYQVSQRTRLGAYYMYGSEFGLTAQIQLNPHEPPTPMRVLPAPIPITPRPARAEAPELWGTDWAEGRAVPLLLRDQLGPAFEAQGLVLESIDLRAHSVELRFRNIEYLSMAQAVGRAARLLALTMPNSVETFHLVPLSGGMALSRVTVRRSDLEALEFDGDATEALLAVAGIGEAPLRAPDALPAADLYPDKSWSFAPYFSPSYFDPAKPLRLDVGVELRGTLRPAPGWVLSGSIRQRLWGNVEGGRASNSVLPHVRTDANLYAQYGTTINTLFAAYQWRPAQDLYARVSVGYFEQMFGGLSTELLWKPVNSRLGLGVELNYALQRDYDQLFGFQDYSVFTGHASAYYEFGNGYHAQVDVGRYLAGDIGATIAVDRVFDNGWEVGAFFTKTNVSAADFGEGSFDKGIRFKVPLGWFLGKPSQQRLGMTIRPVQRDGGARLKVPGRLYEQVRRGHAQALRGQWARAWQ